MLWILNMLSVLNDWLQVKGITDWDELYIFRRVPWTALSEEKWSCLKSTGNDVLFPVDELTQSPSLAFRFSPDKVWDYIFQYNKN